VECTVQKDQRKILFLLNGTARVRFIKVLVEKLSYLYEPYTAHNSKGQCHKITALVFFYSVKHNGLFLNGFFHIFWLNW
jgi:hypothetical protein